MKDPRNPFPEGTPPEGVPKTPDPDAPVIEESPEGGFPLEGPAPEPEPEWQGPIEEVEIDPDAPVIEESPEGGFPLEGPAPEPEPEWQGPIQEVEIDIDNVTPTAGPEPVKTASDEPRRFPEGTPPEGVPAGDDAVPVPIHEQPDTRPRGAGDRGVRAGWVRATTSEPPAEDSGPVPEQDEIDVTSSTRSSPTGCPSRSTTSRGPCPTARCR